MNATPPTPCPTCGRPLPAGHLEGLCPACAWAQLTGGTDEPGPPEPPIAAGLFRVPGHDVLEELARGGAGIVYRARQYQPARDVALKMLQPQQMGSDEMVARFRIEAETIAALDHPAILPVYLVGVHQEMPFFTMKLALGGRLAGRRVAYRGQWRRIAELTATLADAVHFAHSRGVIHRDLKPGNILFDEADRPFVSDFGLAKFTRADAPVTRTQTLMGTPAYLAPEVARLGAHAATTAADVYALGSILYELLAQRPPFAADSLPALLRAIAEDAPVPPQRTFPDLPVDLEVICLRALAKEPAHRFATAAELAAELRRWLAGVPILSRPISSGERLWRWCRRRPALAGLTAALIVTATAGAVAQWFSNRSLAAALVAARAAEAAAQVQLHAALVSEATLRSNSGQAGQRDDALGVLARASRLQPDLAVRSAVASALARDDLRPGPELPAYFPEPTTQLDFAPDLASYLTPAADGGIELRDTADGRILFRYTGAGRSPARLFRFSRDGRRFAALLADRSVALWRTDRAEPLTVLPPSRSTVVAFALHPAEPVVVYASTAGELRHRSLTDGQERVVAGGGAAVVALSFNPTGRRLAVVRAATLDLIEAADGTVVWSQSDAVLGLPPVWSRDGLELLTGNRSRNAIDLRDAATGTVRQTLAGHSTLPHALAFVGTGERLATLGFDGTLRLWDGATGRPILQVPARPRGLTVSPDGQRIGFVGAGDRPSVQTRAEARVWREFSGRPRPGTVPAGLALAPDGHWLAVGALESIRRENASHLVRAVIWDTRREATAGRVDFWSEREDRVTLAFTADAFAYSTSSQGIRQRRIERSPTGRLALGPERVLAPPGRAHLQSIGRDGEWIVRLPSDEYKVVLWPQGDPTRAAPLTLGAAPAPPAAIVEDRYVLLRDQASAPLQVWSRDEARRIGELDIQSPGWAGLSAVAGRAVFLSQDGFRAFTLPALQPIRTWTAREDGSPAKMFAFSRSGRWFASEVGGSGLDLRDARDFSLLLRLEPPFDLEMNGLVWSPDDSRLYVAFRGPRVFVLDVKKLRKELEDRGLNW